MKLGILTGLAREVSCLSENQQNVLIACSGADPWRAETEARALVDGGCGALLSFGIAGALSPDLRVGDIVVSSGVVNGNKATYSSAENWRLRVLDALPKAQERTREGLIYGADTAISSPAGKSQLYAHTGALCVDMESHRLAMVAAETSIPFLAIRVISDDARRALPSSALGVIGKDGRPVITRVLRGLVRHPGQLPSLIALSRDMETALSQLRRVSGLIGPRFRFA